MNGSYSFPFCASALKFWRCYSQGFYIFPQWWVPVQFKFGRNRRTKHTCSTRKHWLRNTALCWLALEPEPPVLAGAVIKLQKKRRLQLWPVFKERKKTSRGILRSEIFQNFFYSKKLWSTWLELEPSSWLAGAGSKWNGSPTTLAKYMENCAQEISSIFRSDVRMPICFRHAKVFLNIKMWKKWPLCISDHHVQCQMTGRTGGFTKEN